MKHLFTSVALAFLLTSCGGSSRKEFKIDPDIRQKYLSLAVVNRDTFDYQRCELEINGLYMTKINLIPAGQTVDIPYNELGTEEGQTWKPDMKINKVAFSCHNSEGELGMLILER